MARIRTIKPQFWEDIKIGKLSIPARLLFIGCWSFSDDHGVILNDAVWLRSNIFKYDKRITRKILGRWVNELVSFGLLIPFEDNGEKYFIIKNFRKHQLINKPSKFYYAIPPTLPECSGNDTGTLPEQSRWDLVSSKKEEGSSKKEVEGESEGKPKVNPPSLSKGENQRPQVRLNGLVNDLTESMDVSSEGKLKEAKRRAFLEVQKKQLGIT